jgi:hypothetical protein
MKQVLEPAAELLPVGQFAHALPGPWLYFPTAQMVLHDAVDPELDNDEPS